mmetsp:Transcript_21221/g.36450  ORF Transcript_21221/g.36450 Transcript_21221/m.36450 type:complete len:137 (+) Transcript_21221:158-568(+)
MEEKSYSKLGGVYSKQDILASDKAYHAELQQMRTTGSNKLCADCGTVGTNWASCNLGIFLCVDCAQVHRGLGTHISKVKSCMGTYLWHPDEMEQMRAIGNDKSNAKFLALNRNPPKDDRKRLIEEKYVKLAYAKKG